MKYNPDISSFINLLQYLETLQHLLFHFNTFPAKKLRNYLPLRSDFSLFPFIFSSIKKKNSYEMHKFVACILQITIFKIETRNNKKSIKKIKQNFSGTT